jgi:hypothetical protein
MYWSLQFGANSDPSLSTCANFKLVGLVCYFISFKISTAYMSHLDDFLNKVSETFEFTDAQIVSYELKILTAIGFDVAPLCTPSGFAHLLFQNASAHQKDIRDVNNVTMLATVEANIGKCLASSDFLPYSTSTLSIAAVIYSCSMMQVDCNDWLYSVPDRCFNPGSKWGSEEFQRAIDVNACLDKITLLLTPKSSRPSTPSSSASVSPSTKRKSGDSPVGITTCVSADLSRCGSDDGSMISCASFDFTDDESFSTLDSKRQKCDSPNYSWDLCGDDELANDLQFFLCRDDDIPPTLFA